MKKLLKIFLLMFSLISMVVLTGCGKEKETVKTFNGKNVRVVIGSTSTSGDSYLIADTVTRYLSKELGANMKVDAVRAAEALNVMQTAKPDGNSIMIFHDLTYLGVLFGAYGEEYALENMEVGPRAAQNPGAAWATRKDSPYNTLVEIPEYLKNNPNEIVRMACETGSVSHVGFVVFYNWVKENYGEDIAKRMVIVVGGGTSDQCQLLWDKNCDVIFADYTALKDYTETDDKQIAMKFIGLMDKIDGAKAPSCKEQGITLNGQEFTFAKDFIIYTPKDFPAELMAELDTAVEKVCSNPEFISDISERMTYRSAYLKSSDAKTFIYNKRDELKKLIDASPSIDELVQK